MKRLWLDEGGGNQSGGRQATVEQTVGKPTNDVLCKHGISMSCQGAGNIDCEVEGLDVNLGSTNSSFDQLVRKRVRCGEYHALPFNSFAQRRLYVFNGITSRGPARHKDYNKARKPKALKKVSEWLSKQVTEKLENDYLRSAIRLNSVNATGKCNRNFTVTDDSIMHAIRTFLSTSTSGPDGLTPQHLKDLTGPLSGITNSRL
ncbi:hypothetical protein GJ496_008376 [Pomphorhynchus laevis]|nr:hypothetical protein GJ496_008376 [Pomphorhynchus laevis]